jgi:hypothetical protein
MLGGLRDEVAIVSWERWESVGGKWIAPDNRFREYFQSTMDVLSAKASTLLYQVFTSTRKNTISMRETKERKSDLPVLSPHTYQ